MSDYNAGVKYNFTKPDGGGTYNSAPYFVYVSAIITASAIMETIPSMKMSTSSTIEAETAIDTIASTLMSVNSEIEAETIIEGQISRIMSILSTIETDAGLDIKASAKLSDLLSREKITQQEYDYIVSQ